MRVDVHGGNKSARADKIINTLEASIRGCTSFQTVQLGDLPLLVLQTEAGPIEVGEGSTGQRAMCVLNLLLLQSASPLLIDQIEEGLDNQYVYEILVKVLRRLKKHRQMILVTHNACIPVLAGADRVFVHEVAKGRGDRPRVRDGRRDAGVAREDPRRGARGVPAARGAVRALPARGEGERQ